MKTSGTLIVNTVVAIIRVLCHGGSNQEVSPALNRAKYSLSFPRSSQLPV
jgi:hypothetical protein